MNYFFEYLGVVNIVGFVLFGYDKFLAKARQRRIPEATLFLAAWLGGAAGCWVGMTLFRHKTRRFKFRFGIPLVLVLQIALYVLWRLYLK